MIEKFFRSSFSTLILWRINKPSLILFGDIYPTRSTFQHRKQSASNHNVEKSTLKRLILHKKCSFASGLSQFEFCHTFQAKNNRYSKMQAGWEYRAEKKRENSNCDNPKANIINYQISCALDFSRFFDVTSYT